MPLIQTTTTIALKDWAVTVEALGTGKQIMLMRKGGIREETRHFEVRGDQFFLYPAYEHQQKEWIKPSLQAEIAKTRIGWSPEDTTTQIKYFAKLYEDVEVIDEKALHRLYPQHIWTHHFTSERFKWKKNLPLHLLLVRVYRLEHPLAILIRPEYLGCKSWLQLPENCHHLPAEPVLTDEEFIEEVWKIKALLAGE
jgi:hypothetical protein